MLHHDCLEVVAPTDQIPAHPGIHGVDDLILNRLEDGVRNSFDRAAAAGHSHLELDVAEGEDGVAVEDVGTGRLELDDPAAIEKVRLAEGWEYLRVEEPLGRESGQGRGDRLLGPRVVPEEVDRRERERSYPIGPLIRR